ncbi:hypothetical protein GINT2_000309 [Glugoides intestinalis]
MHIERYGKPLMSLPEYFTQKQKANQDISTFIRRMEKNGKKLKLTGKVRFEVIRQGITRFQKVMLTIMIGKKKITEELVEEFRQREALVIKFSQEVRPIPAKVEHKNQSIEKRNYKCFSSGKPGHIAKFCRAGKPSQSIYDIEHEIAEANKNSSIYISSSKLKPIFDTGSEDNYITTDLVNHPGLKVLKKKMIEKRYTYLRQLFYVKEYLHIEFIHNERRCHEVFNILPGRKGHMILLGRKWPKKIANDKPKDKKSKEFADLKSKLFTKSPNGIKLDYECTINCKEEDIVSESTFPIPQALERKVQIPHSVTDFRQWKRKTGLSDLQQT